MLLVGDAIEQCLRHKEHTHFNYQHFLLYSINVVLPFPCACEGSHGSILQSLKNDDKEVAGVNRCVTMAFIN